MFKKKAIISVFFLLLSFEFVWKKLSHSNGIDIPVRNNCLIFGDRPFYGKVWVKQGDSSISFHITIFIELIDSIKIAYWAVEDADGVSNALGDI
jgi:hypothetical protein